MSTISSYLTAEHRDADVLFSYAEQAIADGDWTQAESWFQRFAATTLNHFEKEETVVFPAFEQATGNTSGPTRMMRIEHGEIRGMFDRVSNAIAIHDAEGSLGLAETLLIVIQQHNIKEEQVLYPMTDRLFGSQHDALVLQMRQLQSAG